MSRNNDAAHADALRRLDASIEEQRDVARTLDEARGTPSEADAADKLSAVRAQVAAREAWLGWIERGA